MSKPTLCLGLTSPHYGHLKGWIHRGFPEFAEELLNQQKEEDALIYIAHIGKNKLLKNISWSVLSFYHSEDVHYARHHGHRWREPDQLSRTGCNHHQCEESASTLGEGQLQCGHSRKHCQRHTSGGESESTLYIQYVQGQQPLLA